MSVPVQTPEMLQILNNVLVNIVAIIETFGPLAFQLLMIMFVVWLIFEIGRAIRDLIENGS